MISTLYLHREASRLYSMAGQFEERTQQVGTLELHVSDKDRDLRRFREQIRLLELERSQVERRERDSIAKLLEVERRGRQTDQSKRELEERGRDRDKRLETVSGASREKDRKIQQFEARVRQLEKVEKDQKRSADQERAAEVARYKEQSEVVAQLGEELTQLRSKLDFCSTETDSAQKTAAESSRELSSLNEEFAICEDDRLQLFRELNTTRSRVGDVEAERDSAVQCCETVPMCNLCRLRR